ncbi:MAG: hypothetical protein IJ440_03075, partial [Alphaproteobacteria bacterium]|nr:hypothetical protein [Alphaproteobacteria bacterium]
TTCSSSCPKYYSGTTCVTSCPTDRPYLDGTQCKTASEMATICTNAMKAGGFTSGYTVSGDTITYTGDMSLSANLDVSKCNLIVNGTVGSVDVDGKTIKVKNLTVTSSSVCALDISYGSILTVSGNVKVDSTNSYAVCIYDGTVTVSGNIEITTSGYYGLVVNPQTATAKVNANNITATCVGLTGTCASIMGASTVTVTNVISSTGNQWGLYIGHTSSLTAKKIIGTVSSSSYGGVVLGGSAKVTATESILGVAGDNRDGGVSCSEGTTITSPMIYYYPKKNISCTVNGTVNCRSGSTCTN